MSLLFPPHRGVGPGCNTREIAHKLIELKADIEDLEQREQELEQQKMWVQQSIKNVTEDVQNNRYPFASRLFLRAGRQRPEGGVGTALCRGGGHLVLLEDLR